MVGCLLRIHFICSLLDSLQRCVIHRAALSRQSLCAPMAMTLEPQKLCHIKTSAMPSRQRAPTTDQAQLTCCIVRPVVPSVAVSPASVAYTFLTRSITHWGMGTSKPALLSDSAKSQRSALYGAHSQWRYCGLLHHQRPSMSPVPEGAYHSWLPGLQQRR